MADPGLSQTTAGQEPEKGQPGAVQHLLVDDTNPIHSTLKIARAVGTHDFGGPMWESSVGLVAAAKNVAECLTTGTRGNDVAVSTLIEKIPRKWAEKVIFMASAKEAFDWLIHKYKGAIMMIL